MQNPSRPCKEKTPFFTLTELPSLEEEVEDVKVNLLTKNSKETVQDLLQEAILHTKSFSKLPSKEVRIKLKSKRLVILNSSENSHEMSA